MVSRYISSVNYINGLTFDCAESYSLQRGADFDAYMELIRPEYDRLKVRKEKRNNLTEAEGERFRELEGLLTTQYLISDKGQFHFSSNKINTFQSGDPEMLRLIDILRTEIRDVPRWMCAPVYRDAIVFYKNNEIVSTLNVCLSCQHMETTSRILSIDADYETYDLLKQFFIDIGHDVEEPTKFIGPQIEKLREKVKGKN